MQDETAKILIRYEGLVRVLATRYGTSVAAMRAAVYDSLALDSGRIGRAARVGLPIAKAVLRQHKARREAPSMDQMRLAIQCKAGGGDKKSESAKSGMGQSSKPDHEPIIARDQAAAVLVGGQSVRTPENSATTECRSTECKARQWNVLGHYVLERCRVPKMAKNWQTSR